MRFKSALWGIGVTAIVLLAGCGGDAATATPIAATLAPTVPPATPTTAPTASTQSPQPDQGQVAASLGSPFQLMAGQTAAIGSYGPWVKFLEVVEDSRCALDVVCIWVGRAIVRIAVSSTADALGFGAQELTVEVAAVDPEADTVTDASGVYLF